MDSTINGLKNELENLTDNDLLILWASGKTQKMKASKLKDYVREKVMTFQPGEFIGGGITGYSFQIPGQTFGNTAQFTLSLPKDARGRNIKYVAGNIVNIIHNGQSINVSSQTPTMILTNYGYALRLQFTGTFTQNHPVILQMNSNIVFN